MEYRTGLSQAGECTRRLEIGKNAVIENKRISIETTNDLRLAVRMCIICSCTVHVEEEIRLKSDFNPFAATTLRLT